MDNKVKFLRGTATEYEASTKDNDTFYYTTDTKKLYLGETEVGNGIDPKVIQAHIDNQTIHAKVWRGTQEEYNAIEPKEDDTVYIIKDSDNTLADKLIDDTSTTATDKTWSAKKINENDEVARAAISTHAGNADIHVTSEEKASWNGKAELTDIPTSLPADGGNAETLESHPSSHFVQTVDCAGITTSINDWYTPGSYFCNSISTPDYPVDIVGTWGMLHVFVNGSICYQFLMTEYSKIAFRTIIMGQQDWTSWKRLDQCDGGNASTLETHPASDFVLKTDYDALAARVAALEGGTT